MDLKTIKYSEYELQYNNTPWGGQQALKPTFHRKF
jgi:hypothetical protein